MSNKPVVITADSTCDLSKEIMEQYGITYFPYFVRLRDKEYKDNVDIFPTDLYKAFHEDGSLPSTAASSPNEYAQFFSQFTEKGNDVVHISLGHALSSGCQNAELASQQMDGVYVVDSKNLSSGAGLIVLNGARLAEEGKSAKEIATTLEGMTGCVHTSFVLNTLEYMAAGGRCPTVASKAAGMLKCKPSLEVDNTDGSLHMAKMYRGKQEKVLLKYVNDQLSKYDDIDNEDIFLTHSGEFSEEMLSKITNYLKENAGFKNFHYATASCTISSHCGPACFGILFLSKWK